MSEIVKGPAGRTYLLPLSDSDINQAVAEWWEDHRNLALLIRWLEYAGTLDKPSEVLDEPWHWQREFEDALRWYAQEMAA